MGISMRRSIIGHSILTLAASGAGRFNIDNLIFERNGINCLDNKMYDIHIVKKIENNNKSANIHITTDAIDVGINFRKNEDQTIQWDEHKLEQLVNKINEIHSHGDYKIISVNDSFKIEEMWPENSDD